MIERSVDLPHTEGPEIETYSPRTISSVTSESACVSTSSVTNTLVRFRSFTTGGGPLNSMRWLLLKADAIERVPRGHVRQDDLISRVEAGGNFDGIDRAAPESDPRARRDAARLQLEQRDGALFLPECRAAHMHHIVQAFELDCAVHGQIRP